MSYKHLSQTERYQIYALMKAGQNLKTIAQILGRHKSTIGREVLRNSGLRGYRPRQADILCQQRAQASRNACQIDQRTRTLVAERLNLQWSSEQMQLRCLLATKRFTDMFTLTRQAVAYFGSSCAVKRRNVSVRSADETA
jgi:IS30 family transposase